MIELAKLKDHERSYAHTKNCNLIGDVYITKPSLTQSSKKSQQLDNNKLLQLYWQIRIEACFSWRKDLHACAFLRRNAQNNDPLPPTRKCISTDGYKLLAARNCIQAPKASSTILILLLIL